MRIYTRRGDRGETSLADGSRVAKDSARVEAYGTVDELSCVIGLARVAIEDERLDATLRHVQQRLFNCSARLAAGANTASGGPGVDAHDVTFLEAEIDRMSEQAPPFAGFVLPAGPEAVARLHVARAVTRRCERRLLSLSHDEPVDEQVMRYVNRLSDLLFAAARHVAAAQGVADELWEVDAPAPGDVS